MDKTTRYDWSGAYVRGVNGTSSTVHGTILNQNLRTGSSNPGWRSKIKEEVFVSSPYELNAYECTVSSGACGLKWRRLNNGVTESCSTEFVGVDLSNSNANLADPFSASDVNEAKATALSRLLDKVRAEHSETNGMLILGELLETVRMIRRPAAGLLDGVKTYATATKRLAASTRTKRAFVKGLPALYLEHAFGWVPLINDTKDLARTAARAILDDRPLTRVESRVELPPVTVVSTGQGVGPFDCKQNRVSRTYATKSLSAIAYLRNTVSGPIGPLNRLRELSGFTVENFVPTIYNLIPYSFLLDYFSNVGDVISGACTDQSKVIGSQQTTRTIVLSQERFSFDASATIKAVGGSDHAPYGTMTGAVEQKHVQVSRTIGASVPVPDLNLTIPGGRQILNIEALIAGWFSGMRLPRQ